jgi:N6-L-threonylcarbamoyladenine synthase
LRQTLKQGGESIENPGIDYLAVTVGPGLEPALWTGITFAQELSKRWNKPIIPVNHMEGHVFSTLYNIDKPLELPALALLVSGGHTELVHIKDFGDYEVIGHTLDDAAGEAFDKVARMLGLPYPGGPKISKLAEETRKNYENVPRTFSFPRPMINSKDLNFSFSGLKTAVLYKLKAENRADEKFKKIVAREFEDAVVDVLIEKTRQALTKLNETKTLIVAGGVSANTHLANMMATLAEDFPDIKLLLPEKLLSTDNAIMIGIAAYVRARIYSSAFGSDRELVAKGNLSISSRQ